ITDRKRVEEEVRRERDFSTNMINTAAALIVGLNRAGDITIFNKEAEKITKWTREEVLGTNWLDRFVPERYRKQAHLEFERAMKGDILYTQNEVPVITKEGEERVLSCNTTSIKDVTGEVVVGIAIGIDITGRKQAEEELRQKNEELLTMEEDLRELNHRLEDKVRDRTSEIERLLKQKNDFVSQLGHDLRSPLTPLVALLPMLAEREEDAKSKELFNVIIRNVHYMKELVAKTLSLAKLNSAVADFKISNLNLSKALHELLESRRFLFAENNILVENRVSGSITVAADRLRLLELFDNLIANAVRFMHEGGSLIFDAQESGEVVTVGVKDTGIGMTSEQVDRIFDEFYKVDESRQKLDSPGLGLTICKRIVEKHGGTIWAESEGLGKGTAMYFTIPSPRGIACREFDHLIPKATM
ncbi:MAG: PAS domain-containing sensor histidine kinase, partial [Chloroflexota bacterium]|nr:PAS domain-containing sensor histidine kinase [Chloroflexota bacterium]